MMPRHVVSPLRSRRRQVVYGLLFLLLGFMAVFLLSNYNPAVTENQRRDNNQSDSPGHADKKYMTFDHYFNRTFRPKSFYPYWISGYEYVYVSSNGSFVVVNIDDESEDELLPAGTWENVTDASSYYLSADRTFVSVLHNFTREYFHYTWTFSVTFIEVSSGNQVDFPSLPSSGLQKFKWSPANHSFAFVHGFNVYLVQNESTTPKQVTDDGDGQSILNGIPDRMLRVEITGDDALFWWSPDGKYLAYVTLNDTNVTKLEFNIYDKQQYPTMQKIPYSKAGTNLPVISVTIVDSSSLETVVLTQHRDVTKWGEYYLNNAIWTANNSFTPTWKNRYDNESLSENCIAPSFTCSHSSVMMDCISTGWIGHYKPSHLFPSSNGDEYFSVNANKGYTHLVRINGTANEADWRTSGTFEVTNTGYGISSVYFYDRVWDWVYFLSTELESAPGTGLPRIRHLWKVKARGEDKTRTCITCQLNVQFPDRCNWVNPTFSDDGSFLVVNCGGTGNGVPITTLHKRDSEGNYEFARVLRNNTHLQTKVQEFHLREKVYGTIKLPGVDGDWFYSLRKPPNFDENKKYPMLVEVYGGPGSQEVQDYFYLSWKDYVASSLGVIVLSFDGRGSGFRGEHDRHLVYKHLGDFEVVDQISAARVLSEKFKFIDPTRRAIWGWSYGGYATTKAIAEDSENVFKCGFAVAPVTDWTFYHAIYTEKYMLRPQDNAENYNKSSALNNMDNFKTHRYSLIHGTWDENVHFQNSARLNKRLVDSDVDFGSYFAADDGHSMKRVKNGYKHVLKLLTRQTKDCFDLQ